MRNNLNIHNEDHLITENDSIDKKKFKFWKTFEKSVNTITLIAANKRVFNNKYNEDGSVNKVEFNTRLFAFSTNIND